MRCPALRVAHFPLFQDAGLQPFAYQTKKHPVAHPFLENLPQLALVQSVEELSNIHVNDPPAPYLHQPFPEGCQRLVCRPPGPKPVRAVQKLLLIQRLQDHLHRPLQHLVFEGWHTYGAGLAPRALRYVHAPHRWSKVRSRLRSFQQSPEVTPKILGVLLGRLPVHPHRRVFARTLVGFQQPPQVDVIGQRGEAHLRMNPRQLRYPSLFR